MQERRKQDTGQLQLLDPARSRTSRVEEDRPSPTGRGSRRAAQPRQCRGWRPQDGRSRAGRRPSRTSDPLSMLSRRWGPPADPSTPPWCRCCTQREPYPPSLRPARQPRPARTLLTPRSPNLIASPPKDRSTRPAGSLRRDVGAREPEDAWAPAARRPERDMTCPGRNPPPHGSNRCSRPQRQRSCPQAAARRPTPPDRVGHVEVVSAR